MKKLILLIAAVAMMLPSCKKIEDAIDALDNRVTQLEGEKIPSVEQQIESINTSIAELEAVDVALKEQIAELEKSDESTAEEISNLNAKDAELEQMINTLQEYVNSLNQGTKDWISTTFATLEQFNSLSLEVESLKTVLENYKVEVANNLANAISALETSMKQWVNEQLANYYTIAQIDAKIAALEQQIQNGGTEELVSEINSLKSSLQTMKSELTTAYQKAIADAINTNNGVINAKIAEEIAAVNQRITNEINAIKNRLNDIEKRVSDLEDKVDDLLNRKLEITFDNTDDIAVIAGESCKVNYTITSSESEVHIATIAQNGWKASVTKTTEKTGYITVYAPNPLTAEPVIVLVSDTNTTIMRSITFVDGISNIATKSYTLTSEATTLSIDVQTNFDYTLSIPSTASNWISLKNITTRAAVRNDVINLKIEENTAISSRKATLQLVCNDIEVGTISIYQQGVEVANNELVYTSSDKKIINPYQTMGFNANIVSNTYSNGRGLIVFDKDITAISEYAFYNCTKLTSIQMPKSITKIREYAFYCTALSEINIPSNTTEIASYAFYSTNLTNLVVPDNVITIGDYTFYDCNLKNVIIGQGVTWIGARAFYHCGNLTSIYCKPMTPPAVYYTIYSGDGNYKDSFPNNSDMKIYVPRNSYDSYMQYSGSKSGCYVENWYGYKNILMAYDFE